jgi:hypothetical protein
LINARIMRNWTQKKLADKLAVAEQQVQRYEATRQSCHDRCLERQHFSKIDQAAGVAEF